MSFLGNEDCRKEGKEKETDCDDVNRGPSSDLEESGRGPRHTWQEIAAAPTVIIPAISFGAMLRLGSWKAYVRLISIAGDGRYSNHGPHFEELA